MIRLMTANATGKEHEERYSVFRARAGAVLQAYSLPSFAPSFTFTVVPRIGSL
jgi:hypothetical protein